MKVNFYCFCVAFLFSINAYSQIWIDDFDGSNTVPFSIDLECSPDVLAYFGVSCCGAGCGAIEAPPLFCAFYGGLDGNFIGANDTDNAGSGCDGNADKDA